MSQGFKRVEVNCNVKDFLPLESLKVIQGDLKTLTQENYLKFKKQLLKEGIIRPFLIWYDNGRPCILDGTQMFRTLTALNNEGFVIPLIPVVEVRANDIKEAKRKLISLMSQYGIIEGQELLEFSTDIGFSDMADLASVSRFPDIDFKKLNDEHTKDGTDKKEKQLKKCPKCGEEI